MSDHRYRHHELGLAEGDKLVLKTDGSIEHIDEAGATARTWTPDDPEWPDQALRFGLRPEVPTVAPPGRNTPETKPKRW